MNASNKNSDNKNEQGGPSLKTEKKESHVLESLRAQAKASLAKKLLEQLGRTGIERSGQLSDSFIKGFEKTSKVGQLSFSPKTELVFSLECLQRLVDQSRIKVNPLKLTPETAGKILRERRKELKLSQAEVGDAVNLSLNSLVKIENGDSDCKISNFFALCNFLGIKISLEVESENE